MATQMVMQAYGPTTALPPFDNTSNAADMARKPLPSLPSPTLTNPDMVLPNEPRRHAGAMNSPPRFRRHGDGPPSPSYLRDVGRLRAGSNEGSDMVTPKKEKLGLMSRKMMLLRSRTASNGVQLVIGSQEEAQQHHHVFEGFDSAYGSSPTLRDVSNLAPPEPPQQQRRGSGDNSSLGSDEMASLPQFLAKYEGQGSETTEDDEDEPGTPKYEESVDGRLEAARRQQQEDEHTSALLSQRAEQILANAKKRLNLMEGNLRGARDLVQPLTAANLKRATSVASYVSPARPYGGRNRAIYDGYHDSPSGRRLHAQASAPHLDHEYHQGHSRGFSETEIPDRPYTAVDMSHYPGLPHRTVDSTAQDQAWTNTLRGSRSYDALGSFYPQVSGHTTSPDPNLGSLPEDDDSIYRHQYHAMSTPLPQNGFISHDPYGYSGSQHSESQRSESRSSDLREQMSSLKGRISSLRERAKEDSLRRQSMQNLREPSPLNNATANAPEFFYQSSAEYDGRAGFDTQARVGWKVDQGKERGRNMTTQRQQTSPQQGLGHVWDARQGGYTGSRNAFAEEAERTRGEQHREEQALTSQKRSQHGREPSADHQVGTATAVVYHKRTPSGTAIVQSSKQRYSHHQQKTSGDSTPSSRTPTTPPNNTQRGLAIMTKPQPQPVPDDDLQSETGDTVYEDATSEPTASVVPHEDREDAFDYKEFFLSSAMKVYGGKRRASESESASGESEASTVTARGPTTAVGPAEEDDSFIDEDEDDERQYGDVEDFLPSSPETPEHLRNIERNLTIPRHERNASETSVSTLATFATATEGRQTPSPPPSSGNAFADQERQRATPGGWPIATSSSRPSTAIPIPKQLSPLARSEGDASERADSGVGGFPSHAQSKTMRPGSSLSARRAVSAGTALKPTTSTTGARSTDLASPPTSPPAYTDPATAVVQALLGDAAARLGLRDKKVLFGVVEGLMGVCRDLREDRDVRMGVEGGEEGERRRRRRARDRLEEVEKALAEG